MRPGIDHSSQPEIASQNDFPWSADIVKLAEETDSFCKISRMMTEASDNWRVEDLKPYVDHLPDCFGPQRLICGSGWPVCTLAATHDQWMDAARHLFAGRTDDDFSAMIGANAMRPYRLKDT